MCKKDHFISFPIRTVACFIEEHGINAKWHSDISRIPIKTRKRNTSKLWSTPFDVSPEKLVPLYTWEALLFVECRKACEHTVQFGHYVLQTSI